MSVAMPPRQTRQAEQKFGKNRSFPYSDEPSSKDEASAYKINMDRSYTRLAGIYDRALRISPLFWGKWIERALPHVRGPRVLEVSFGTGHLLLRYAGRVREAHGVDLNERMVEIARDNLRNAGLPHRLLLRGDVESLPYEDNRFDTVLCTMSFSGYPDADAAMAEMKRVLRPGGNMVVIDVGFPADRNWMGMAMASAWRGMGDMLRDMDAVFGRNGLSYSWEEIGGFGSVHLYVATRAGEI